MYRLDNRFTRGHFTVTVVGCGGTGGFLAEGLCRLLPPHARLVLVDHDRVEQRNLSRQVFLRKELGQFKSEALALRLARRHGRPISYSTLPIAMAEIQIPGLIIGCVDNGPARRDIAKSIKDRLFNPYGYISWWVDAGNGENYGQIIIGNDSEVIFDPGNGVAYALPLPTIQRSELLAQAPRQVDCAQIAEQGPTINQTMAALLVEVVRRIIDGTCHWMQLYIDMDAGMLHPVPATPEAVKRMGIKLKLMKGR